MHDLKVMLVDDDEKFNRAACNMLREGGIELKVYETAEELVDKLKLDGQEKITEIPDLIIVDWQLKPMRMAGRDLILKLIENRRRIPSALMVVSGIISPEAPEILNDNVEIFGQACLGGKPIDDVFRSKVIRMAKIGKNLKNRLKRDKPSFSGDMDRSDRPIFISYASPDPHDGYYANGIRLNIEAEGLDVWYGPITFNAKEEQRSRQRCDISDGIDNACVFIPIVTENYFNTEKYNCSSELESFRKRMDSDGRKKLSILPVVFPKVKEDNSYNTYDIIKSNFGFLKNGGQLIDEDDYFSMAKFKIDRFEKLIAKLKDLIKN